MKQGEIVNFRHIGPTFQYPVAQPERKIIPDFPLQCQQEIFSPALQISAG